MLLAADVFDEILAAATAAGQAGPGVAADAGPSAGPTTGGGQRRESRVAVGGRVTVVPFAPGAERLAGYDFPRGPDGALRLPLADPLSVPVRDLSRGGVRFMMPRRLPLDAPFVLFLPRAAADGRSPRPTTSVECTVTYWQPVRRDLFAIGARFLRVLDGVAVPRQPPVVLLPELNRGTQLRLAI